MVLCSRYIDLEIPVTPKLHRKGLCLSRKLKINDRGERVGAPQRYNYPQAPTPSHLVRRHPSIKVRPSSPITFNPSVFTNHNRSVTAPIYAAVTSRLEMEMPDQPEDVASPPWSWPPLSTYQVVLQSGARFSVDQCNLRYVATNTAGVKARSSWGCKAQARLREAWEFVAQWCGFEPDEESVKELVAAALCSKRVRAPRATVVALRYQLEALPREEDPSVAVEGPIGQADLGVQDDDGLVEAFGLPRPAGFQSSARCCAPG